MAADERNAIIEQLTRETTHMRIEIIRMISEAGSGHPGGSLSAIDLIQTLYAHHLRQSAQAPEDPERDRFILSKGHGVPALYAVLAARGYFPADQLMSLRKLGSPLQGHPVRGTVPGIEACTGSLGQGLSIGVGMALAGQLDAKDYRVFCMLGDGEIQEGQVWEAAMSAGKYKLNNLIGILDVNKAQIDGLTEDVMPLEPLDAKFEAFGWATHRIDGHDFHAILDAYEWAKGALGKPKMIIADTIKGKGVSFMEQDLVGWHGVAPNAEQRDAAIAELERA